MKCLPQLCFLPHAMHPDNTLCFSLDMQARVVAEVGRILDVAARQANACRDAADQLAYLHGELEDSRVPAYDVPTALEVLQTGMLTAPLACCLHSLCTSKPLHYEAAAPPCCKPWTISAGRGPLPCKESTWLAYKCSLRCMFQAT